MFSTFIIKQFKDVLFIATKRNFKVPNGLLKLLSLCGIMDSPVHPILWIAAGTKQRMTVRERESQYECIVASTEIILGAAVQSLHL